MIYRYEELDFLRLAFKYGKHYGNMEFVINKMNLYFNFNIESTKSFDDAYSLSKYIANLITSNLDIEIILNWTFYCFSLINNQVIDRKVPNTNKIKKSNSRLKNQILNKDGKYYSLHQLKHLFIKINWLPNEWEFSKSCLITDIDKYV